MTRRYYLLFAASEMVWAVIAYLITGGIRGAAFWGGLVSAPIVGIVAGMIYWPVYRY